MTSQIAAERKYGWKAREVEELSQLVNSSRTIGVFELVSVRSNTIHEARKALRDFCVIRVAKKSLFLKAVEKAVRSEARQLVDQLNRPVGFVFASLNPFRLSLILEKNRIQTFARAGEKADFDVWVPETNTGLAPGPVISDFGKMKIPTKIEGGQIWIARDTLVAKKGDVISPQLASLLTKLNIKSVLRGLSLTRALDGSVLLKGSELVLDLERIKSQLIELYQRGIALATVAGYVTSETLRPIIMLAFRQAAALASDSGYVDRDTVEHVLLRAEQLAVALSERLRTD